MDDIGLHEAAYLCGGPERVAVAALVALAAAGRIRITPGRHRVSVLVREPDGPVEAAVLDAVPDAGRVLGAAVRDVAGSPAVAAVRDALRADGLIARHRVPGLPTLTAKGRRLRRALTEEPPAGLRVAVLGPDAIADDKLRRTFTTPDPPPASSLLPKRERGGEHCGEYSAPDRSLDYGGTAGGDTY
ncbi:TIGR04222 domain-containing membrane protein [Actinomadura rayongensis]|uniref:TIGR04222 domain-containing membrane protein n=1 Tax=Actinomadura rayongensis TaxID=1429076 RepID=A0A6I4WIV9_9ACTN|nr:TIGR04222 domain-containing membrane protein [Actinomadura rayongensis]